MWLNICGATQYRKYFAIHTMLERTFQAQNKHVELRRNFELERKFDLVSRLGAPSVEFSDALYRDFKEFW